jgi:hypothetical protein
MVASPAVPLASERDESGEVLTISNVCRCVGYVATRSHDAVDQRREAFQPTRAEYDLGTTFGEQERSRLTDTAACAGDGDDLAFDF